MLPGKKVGLAALGIAVLFGVGGASHTAAAADAYRVIYIAPQLNNAADIVIARNWQEVAQSLGMEAVIKNAEIDPKREADEWATAIALGYDAIVGGPTDSVAATVSVKKANEAGIPVFMLGRTSEGGKVELIARADNISLGTIAAEELVKRIAALRGEAAGKVLELHGPMDQVNARQRSEAIQAVLANYPKIELIRKLQHWTPEEYFDITKSVASSTDLVGITMGSDVLPGVDAALDSIGKLKKVGDPEHIVVTGIDADPRVLDLMGQDLWDASALQDMVGYGAILAHYMKDYLDGSYKITAAGPIDNPGKPYHGVEARWSEATQGWEIQTPSRVVDKSNHTDPTLWGNAIKKYQ
ncbi:MAG: sugar ABC transporter substrate-binding protein [Alphaproteobacteria bacterium]|nr:sugar ABC transporter substrate-binding protein [Alphaproteobacteria bacterium]